MLLLVTLALIAYGVTIIYFATRNDPLPTARYYAGSQLVYGAVGLRRLFAR